MYWEELSGHFDPRDGGALFAREGDGSDRHDYYVAGVLIAVGDFRVISL